ncbi:MAG: hypothetical protein IT181_20815 [Acidobacteria bacterium]|nr:hypothetical protein [Acidobacteriota bacterium]
MKVLGLMVVAALASASHGWAGPVVRVAAGAHAAASQAAGDAFRADLGGANNGNTAGTQASGRREINWDGGGAAANVTLDPSPMTRFSARGATFLTPGTGFEISGQPAPLMVELNAGYAGLFAAFSAPRVFSPLDSNVMDAVFHVPGNTAVPAAVTGFGAVFTNVDLAGATRMRFYAPDGALLYERAVPAATGNATLSFLGVSFNAGEVVSRVEIVTGNVALGLNEKVGANVVVMDDFIYAEPVAPQGLTLTPGTGTTFRSAATEFVIALGAAPGALTAGRIWFDGYDVTASLLGCLRPGTISGGGQTFRCTLAAGLVPAGEHTLQVELQFGAERRRNAVRWSVVANTEP